MSLLLAYVAVAVAAYYSTLSPGVLLLRVGLCQGEPCVAWVMPAGKAWDQGARPGVKVLSADGRGLVGVGEDDIPQEAREEAELLTQPGGALRLAVTQNAIGQSPMKFSMWALGGMFAVMGALVILRRPDLYAARVFGLFATATSLALAVAPSSGGPGPQWALVMQIVTLTGVGVFFFPFAVALLGEDRGVHRIASLTVFLILGVSILVAYTFSVSFNPILYHLVRPTLHLFISSSAIGAVGFLAIQGSRQQSPAHRQQARIALWGIALGTLPFIALTLIPEIIVERSLLPNHFTVLTWGLISASFAYAILQHQMLGIRRLIHRGIVYWITTVVLLVVVALGLVLTVSFTQTSSDGRYSLSIVLTTLVAGIALFFPLRAGSRWLVDRMIYRDTLDYRTLVSVVHEDLISLRETQEVAAGLARGLAQGLNLESVLIFLGDNPAGLHLAASAGEHSGDVAQRLRLELESRIAEMDGGKLVELRWESDSLLMSPLRSAEGVLGYVVLGPKQGGEVFIEEEKQVIATVVPFLELALDKSRLSEDLRELNNRMLQAEETERARIARDIHDGPLQKATLMAGSLKGVNESASEMARLLASELREVCSRLRPTMLDDLGLIPALDWLLEGVSRQSGISVQLVLEEVDEYDRFSPEIELALYRLTQEATNNALKHSRGTALTASVRREDNALLLKVSDDGVGFSPESRNRGGFGISGMHERIIQLGGKLEIQSASGLGTTVIARIPLTENRPHRNAHELAHKSSHS